MDILLNDILHLSAAEIEDSKIELNMQYGDRPVRDLWLESPKEEKESGTCKCSFWGWYGGQRNYFPGQKAFSFCRMPSQDEWLFISAARIKDTPKDDWAVFDVLEEYAHLFGRLIIRCYKGDTFARYTFNLSKYLNNATVKEILPCMYDGIDFSGYDNVCVSFKELETIISRQKRDWVNALSNQKAVYLITDNHTGKQYVGSATSESGMLLARWTNYVANGHGGNKELKTLVDEKGFDYVRENFQFSILENYNSKVDDGVILSRESWWKSALRTREFGYNKN